MRLAITANRYNRKGIFMAGLEEFIGRWRVRVRTTRSKVGFEKAKNVIPAGRPERSPSLFKNQRCV
jgi:hypothetical protein